MHNPATTTNLLRYITIMRNYNMDKKTATLNWYRANYVGKKFIVQFTSKGLEDDDPNKRGSIVHIWDFGKSHNGISKLFTITTEKLTDIGYYLVQLSSVNIDKKGYPMCIVKVLRRIDVDPYNWVMEDLDIKDQVGWWFIMNDCDEFATFYRNEYPVPGYHGYTCGPNYSELNSICKNTDTISDMALEILSRYIEGNNNILTLAGELLTTKSSKDQIISSLTYAYQNGKLDDIFGKDYPLLCKKLPLNVDDIYGISKAINEYLNRQKFAYDDFVEDGKILRVSVRNDEMPLVYAETALAYREYLKLLSKNRPDKIKIDELLAAHPYLHIIR